MQDLIAGFDQEAAAVITARLASHKMEVEDDFDATRWLDRTLIRLTSRFGDFRKDDPDTFQLSPNMSYFPQFMFNLRRSQFVQVCYALRFALCVAYNLQPAVVMHLSACPAPVSKHDRLDSGLAEACCFVS